MFERLFPPGEPVHSIQAVFEALPFLLQGSLITIVLVLGALALGFCLGLPLAVLQVYGPRPVARLVGLYVWFFRGVPILLLLFLFYFGLFTLMDIDVGTIGASCLVLGLASSAYQSQIFRGTIQGLPQGQFRAARALGLSDFQAIRAVVLPQALRLSIPGWSNEYSILLKDSTLCFVLGTPEMMANTHFVATSTGVLLPMYIAAGFIYFCITLIGIQALRALERKVRIPGYTTAAF